MASMVKLSAQMDDVIDEVYKKINEAESHRQEEFLAAVRVQAWFRASRVRRYLEHLDKSAVKIQNVWRGFNGRNHFRNILKEKVYDMKLQYYNNVAVQIQKLWRGYYTRKYVFNYYSRKKYLEGLMVKNEIVRNELAEYAEQKEEEQVWKAEEIARRRLEAYAKKHHHLVSTEVIPGIYNSPFNPYPDEMEFHLRLTKPDPPKKKKQGTRFDPAWKSYDLPVTEPLPPISAKPQGPFRDPRIVQKQRYKPFQPSLRVQTNFVSLEEAREKMKQKEWVTRLNDDVFQPFTRKSYPYESTLHGTSQFGSLLYGTKYFRIEQPDQFVVTKNFQTVVPPIPVFDKLNDTYSQGQV